ncbi:unnamed protein product [Didymodactylos carnosus]|uniref:SWIM-type domain-containing protein n=1 Tax=Didymodactylos carnosus TaxID=1234261 RepID=A0A816BZF8_9BILA|nr:unnamed protein product [Didymodactylos carnosus]CAF1615964.1 unnamed protein product [Didymodactylos carnosus]CAF4067216.1 unnamed protein product [Didymodactylos carnosus]CAF4502751.1 unnamed protein product [Didymodactylos carnosus]
MDAYTWLQQYHFIPWLTFDEFTRWLYSARLVSMPMMCSCKQNLKLYVCKHAAGFMIHLNLYVIADPAKLQVLGKRRGRPKKAGKALSQS